MCPLVGSENCSLEHVCIYVCLYVHIGINYYYCVNFSEHFRGSHSYLK